MKRSLLLFAALAVPALSQVTIPIEDIAAMTSAQLAARVSDETGTGPLVLANSPVLVTPNIGAATGTSVNLTGTGTFGGTVTTQQRFASDTNFSWSALSATGVRVQAQTSWGAVLGGYGSTYDVSLLNRAGAVALGIAANTTDVEISGRLGVNRAASATQQAAIFANNWVGGAGYTSLVAGTRTYTGAAAGTEGIALRANHDFSSNVGAGWTFTTRTTAGVEQAALTLASTRDATFGGNLTVSGVYVSDGTTAFSRAGMNGQSAQTVLNLTSDGQSAGDAPGLAFNARDSGGTAQVYASLRAQIVSPTAGNESGSMEVYTTTSGNASTLAASFAGGGATLPGTLTVGGGSTVTKWLTATGTLDFGSIAAAASADLTLTVTGAAVGQTVALGLQSAPTAGIVFNAFVSGPNTVTVRATNITGTPVDPASATYRATVVSF